MAIVEQPRLGEAAMSRLTRRHKGDREASR
jgi:hypothetical protein